jgi:uncharacterized DUF497 family protein
LQELEAQGSSAVAGRRFRQPLGEDAMMTFGSHRGYHNRGRCPIETVKLYWKRIADGFIAQFGLSEEAVVAIPAAEWQIIQERSTDELANMLWEWAGLVRLPDPDHSGREERYLLLGSSTAGRLVVVAHTERGDRIRIISARKPTRPERRQYEQGSE